VNTEKNSAIATLAPPSAVDFEERNRIVHAIQKGEFWKPCPGTTAGYYCCGYQIITPMTGCGMYCRYCILQAYLEQQHQVVFDNFEQLQQEVREKLARWQGVVRFGTGEFADSLYLEPQLGISKKIAALLAPYPNVLVEFKSKSINSDSLDAIADKSKVVVGFSMNTPAMIAALEQGTADLEQRLAAARRCVKKGFWVAFHFDPMVHYPGWEEQYRAVVGKIFEAIEQPQKIAWWSMGGFRTMPSLKKMLRAQGSHLPLFNGELVAGEDRKLRYFRPIRIDFYRAMQQEVERYYPRVPLYLCMESPEVWERSGMSKRIPNGLVDYLDTRAEIMLGLRQQSNNPWLDNAHTLECTQ
jgi:spore photoproduct lyase